jgi:hypothetical protein
MKYPHKDDLDIAALNRLPSTQYAVEDKPFLFTQRYSLSPDFEPSDVTAKLRVDTQGAMDMQYWLSVWKESTL